MSHAAGTRVQEHIGDPVSDKPPLPQAKLCDSYKGAVQQDCLDTVLRKQAQQTPPAQQQQPNKAMPNGPAKSGG